MNTCVYNIKENFYLQTKQKYAQFITGAWLVTREELTLQQGKKKPKLKQGQMQRWQASEHANETWRQRLRIFVLSLLADGHVRRVVAWTADQWDTYSSGWISSNVGDDKQLNVRRRLRRQDVGWLNVECRATEPHVTERQTSNRGRIWLLTVGWMNLGRDNFSSRTSARSRSTELLSRCRNVDFSFYVCTWQRLTKKWLDFTVRAGHTTIDIMGHSSQRQVRRQRRTRCTASRARHNTKIDRDRYRWKRGDWRDNVAHNNSNGPSYSNTLIAFGV